MKRTTKRPNVIRKSLGFETLENRSLMAAGITASLTSGVLNITGTSGNDSIIVRQASNQISIDGITTKFASSTVQSIHINGGTGNDFIELDTLNVGSTKYNKPITVADSGGNDDVRGTNGKDVFINGTSHTITSDVSGTILLDGKAPTWADTNIHDAALRQLLDQDLANGGTITRTEMLAVFKQVDTNGTFTASEFNDLTAIANNAALFGTNTAVAVLTHDVVVGNAANKTYLGANLGNLSATSTTATLDKLVGKWFLGTDHPVDTVNGTTYTYAKASGTLFGANGPVYTDVHQGADGDCYFVGALGEIALQNKAAIQNMFIVNGDGTYTVRFYNGGKADYVTVDSMLPQTSYGTFVFADMGQKLTSTTNVLWVALAEKAYAEMNQSGWLRANGLPGNGVNSYSAIAGGYMSDVTAQVANVSAGNYALGSTPDAVGAAFNAGKLVGFASNSNPSSPLVVGGHQYVVVGYNSTTKMFTLFNPWGINNSSSYAGTITVNWATIQANFGYTTHN